jgi:hypothetical protein
MSESVDVVTKAVLCLEAIRLDNSEAGRGKESKYHKVREMKGERCYMEELAGEWRVVRR